MGHLSFGDDMKNLVIFHVVLSALVVAAVVATPVERTNGVISARDEDSAPEDGKHLTAANRGFQNQHSAFLPYPYHLIDADVRRNLDKRSPQKVFVGGKKSFKKVGKGGKNIGKGFKPGTPQNKKGKFGAKNIGKGFKPGTPQNKKGKGKAKFGGKNKGKAFKPGTPQNKKAKSKGKKGGKKAKKGGKKAGKGAKKSSPLSVPAGGGSLAFGVPFTGFDGVVVPGLAAAGFDYVAG